MGKVISLMKARGAIQTRGGFKAEAVALLDAGRMAITEHAKQRMEERGISRVEVENCIRRGHLVQDPYQDQRGSWRGDLVRNQGTAALTVALAIDPETRMVVVTTF